MFESPRVQIANRRATSWSAGRCVALAVLLTLFGVFASGCGFLDRPGRMFSDRFADKDTAVAEMGGPPVDAAMLEGSDWVLVPPDPRMPADAALPRRRHPTLEPLLAMPPAERPNFVPALDHPEAPVRANAAIGLARWGDGRGLNVLVQTVDDAQLRLTLREAAAEAIGDVTKPSPVPALRKLLQNWGRYEASRALVYSPELHSHLIRALSRHVDPHEDVLFLEALRSPTVGPRQEALEAFARSKQGELPPAVVDLRADPNAQIRATVVALLIDRKHPQALDFARGAMQDYETDVRAAAVAALGRHGGPEARGALDRIMLHEGEVLRAEAVSALETLGAWDSVQAAAGDKAWRVRRAVATALANHPDRTGSALARRFLADDSSEVRKAAITALEAWPLPAAGPVLLSALEESTFETRRLAGEQLARRWPAAQAFSNDLPADRRTAVVAELETTWTAQFGVIDRVALLSAMAKPLPVEGAVVQASYSAPVAPPSAERIDRMQQWLADVQQDESAAASLDSFGPDAVDVLERLVLERGAVLPEAVYKQSLPPRDAAFAALDQLTWPDVQDRRRAADRLAESAERTPLRPLAVARLTALGIKEEDGLVWRGLFKAVAADPGDVAASLAYAGLGHPSPEVRRLSCEHLGRSPHPRHTPALLGALSDPHVSVVIEAVRALGSPGLLTDSSPLEPLTAAGDVHLRFSAALTLHRNRLPAGTAALERLAHDKETDIRRRAAATMGTTADPVFIPTLVALLDDSLGVRQAAVESLTKLVGTDVSLRPGEPLPSLSDRAAAWKTWHSRSN